MLTLLLGYSHTHASMRAGHIGSKVVRESVSHLIYWYVTRFCAYRKPQEPWGVWRRVWHAVWGSSLQHCAYPASFPRFHSSFISRIIILSPPCPRCTAWDSMWLTKISQYTHISLTHTRPECLLFCVCTEKRRCVRLGTGRIQVYLFFLPPSSCTDEGN